MHDHGGPQLSRTGSVGFLMLICSLGIGHQHGRGCSDGQFAEAAGTGAADAEICVLQQAGNLIAEGSLHQVGVVELLGIRVVAAAEMNHAAASLQQLRQHPSHHSVQTHGSLAAPHYQQQRSLALGDPDRQSLADPKTFSDRGAGHYGSAAGDPLCSGRQADGHHRAEAGQQPCHPAGDDIRFMQKHRSAAPSRRQNCRGCDIATGGEHHTAVLLPDQSANLDGGCQQLQELADFAQPPPLQTTSSHCREPVTPRHQLGFQAIRHSQPAHTP